LFFYFDPPFFKKADGLYRCYFNKEEHKQLHKEIICLRYDWVLSYDNAPEIRRLYSNDKYIPMHIEVPYSINSHAKRIEKELIITPLALPRFS
jgi:DNA adenine methylase